MIQIIKKGNIPKYVAVCPYCGCKFTYQEDDLYNIDEYFRLNSLGYYVKCPMDGCGTIIAINKNLVYFEELEEMKLNA